MSLPITRAAIATLVSLPWPAFAQQVEFSTLGTPVPALSPFAVVLLGLLVAGFAYWLTRKRAATTRVLAIATMAAGTAHLASHTEVVAQAWAGAPAEQVGATKSPVLLTNPTDGLRYQIQNNTGGAIVITALVDSTPPTPGCPGAGSYWNVEPEEGYQIGVPGCAPQVIVPAGKTCVALVFCDGGET